MAGALSALCQGWARPGPRLAVSENGCYVVYALRRAVSGWLSGALDRAPFFKPL